MPVTATIAPPSAGPTSRDTAMMVLLAATALGRSSRQTSWNRRACIAGRSTASTSPDSKVRA